MKKVYTTPEYKVWQKRKLQRIQRRARKKKPGSSNGGISTTNGLIPQGLSDIKSPVFAPIDFRLMENTEGCLTVFRDIRSELYVSKSRNMRYVILSLRDITQIDYGTISILTAISDDLKYKRIIFRVFLPEDVECKQFMIDSGFLNNMFDSYGKPYPKTEKSELIFFEKGSGVLSEKDNRRISSLVKNVVNHLIGESKYCLAVKTIILEVCGNSIEWSGTESKQWLLGVKYENERVVFTVTDVGRGILDTLNRKFKAILKDLFTLKSDDDILKGAFEKKYGSTTEETNRNKGLPAVKANFLQGTIDNLKVLTNSVILHFDDDKQSRTFERGFSRFKGTFYQWEMTKACINKISI